MLKWFFRKNLRKISVIHSLHIIYIFLWINVQYLRKIRPEAGFWNNILLELFEKAVYSAAGANTVMSLLSLLFLYMLCLAIFNSSLTPYALSRVLHSPSLGKDSTAFCKSKKAKYIFSFYSLNFFFCFFTIYSRIFFQMLLLCDKSKKFLYTF